MSIPIINLDILNQRIHLVLIDLKVKKNTLDKMK